MERFDPDLYRDFRPDYPLELFAGLKELLLQSGFREPFIVADIGCGLGHAAWALYRSGWKACVIGVEPDSAMLEESKEFWFVKNQETGSRSADGWSWSIQNGSGENTKLPAQRMDYAMVASAFHWMDGAMAAKEFFRILKPGGILHVFEYQFPKALDRPELNEWIRRQFNLYWKAPAQKPRGTLKQLTQVFYKNSDFQWIDDFSPPMILNWGVGELAGFLFSQSRVRHYLKTLSPVQQKEAEDEVRMRLESELGAQKWAFDFKLTSQRIRRL